MEENKSSLFARLLIFFGSFFFICNSVLNFFKTFPTPIFVINLVFNIAQIVTGIFLVFISLKNTKKGYQLFIGLIFSGWGIINLFITILFPESRYYWWPLYLITAGVFLLISGLAKYRKLKFGYAIPGFVLLCMGIWFSLFSLGILKIPFKTIALVLGPVFIVVTGLVLVLFFLVQQHHKELIVVDEDSGDFGDEELTFPKLD